MTCTTKKITKVRELAKNCSFELPLGGLNMVMGKIDEEKIKKNQKYPTSGIDVHIERLKD